MRKLALLTVIGVYNGVNSSIYAKHIKVATRYLLIATLGVQEALPVLFPSECTTVHAVEMYVSQSYSIGESENSQEIKIYQGFGALKVAPIISHCLFAVHFVSSIGEAACQRRR